MSAPNARKLSDIKKLAEDNYEVITDDLHNIKVKFHGPKDTPYEGGVWKVHVKLPEDYPHKPPSIKFVNKILHPYIDTKTGDVCVSALNKNWTSRYNLSIIFEMVLPQLLAQPYSHKHLRPSVGDAAAVLRQNGEEGYKKIVAEYVQKYATENALSNQENKSDNGDKKELPSTQVSNEDVV